MIDITQAMDMPKESGRREKGKQEKSPYNERGKEKEIEKGSVN
jgi:hypothetical protein